MNIFWLDINTNLAAQYHVDKHVVKMILEYAQLLSTAHRLCDGIPFIGKSKTNRNVTRWRLPNTIDATIYQATHINHPSAVWTRQSANNYTALWCLFHDVCKEYTYRYQKTHKIEATGLLETLRTPPQNIANGPFTQPTPAMSDEYKIPGDSIASYRAYYMGAKRTMAKWKNRPTPHWYE